MADRNQNYDAVIGSPLGRLGIRARAALTAIDFLPARTPLKTPANPVARAVCAQLRAYFADPQTRFDLPLAPPGTVFQRLVWRALRRIPSGATRRYGELAAVVRSAPRAVGGACRANPIPIVVPCHRVVAAAGLGGYTGSTHSRAVHIKRWLLAHERRG